MTDSRYYFKFVDDGGNFGYEVLYRPDGTEVCFLTEPEDRTFYRDLRSVIIELNRLYALTSTLEE